MVPTSLIELKVRAPGFAHLSAFDELCRGHMVADIPAIVSTLDVVLEKLIDESTSGATD